MYTFWERLDTIQKESLIETLIGKCHLHPSSKFKPIIKHRDAFDNRIIFACKDCIDNISLSGNLLGIAYYCYECGIVFGGPIEKYFEDIGVLSGGTGIRYDCKNCGTTIGVDWYTVS